MLNPIRCLHTAFPVFLLSCALGAPVEAGEITVRADRNQLKQGEPVYVTVTVRGSRVRPVVTPPNVPYCQIEAAGERQSAAGAGGVPKANGRLGQAIGGLEDQMQKLPGELARRGAGEAAIPSEYQDMLRDIRRQAVAALNSPRGPADYEVVYRVTPQRTGELTLPPFFVKVGGQAYSTKSLTLVVEPSNTHDSKHSTRAQAEAVSDAGSAETNLPVDARGLGLKTWHWALALVGGACLGLGAFLILKRRPALPLGEHARAPRQASVSIERLSSAGSADELAHQLMAVARTRCRLPAGELTPPETADALLASGVSVDLAGRFANLLTDCATARFAPRPAEIAMDELARGARQLLSELGDLQRHAHSQPMMA